MWKYTVAGVALGLSACTTTGSASKQGALHDAFEAPVSVAEVYRRAHEQAEMCLRGESKHQVEGALDATGRSAQVYVRAPLSASRLVSVEVQALDESRAQVSVAMWGVNIWDRHALLAMRDAILIGVPTCRNYMPTAGKNRRARGR